MLHKYGIYDPYSSMFCSGIRFKIAFGGGMHTAFVVMFSTYRILTSETFSDTSECFNFLKNFQEMDKDLGEKWKWVSQTLCYAKNWTLAVTISKIIVNLPVESGKSALSALIWILLHDDGATC